MKYRFQFFFFVAPLLFRVFPIGLSVLRVVVEQCTKCTFSAIRKPPIDAYTFFPKADEGRSGLETIHNRRVRFSRHRRASIRAVRMDIRTGRSAENGLNGRFGCNRTVETLESRITTLGRLFFTAFPPLNPYKRRFRHRPE